MFTPPTKAVSKSIAKPGETLTYTISHTMGTFYKTAMTVYGKLVFTDVLPEHLIYKSAKLTNGSGTNITSQGTLSYDESTRKLTFTMGDAWRTNTVNYNGQVLKFTVTAAVEDFEENIVTIKNKANVSYENNMTVTTNEVTTTLVKVPEIRIVKKIPDSDVQVGNGHGNPTFIFKIKWK